VDDHAPGLTIRKLFLESFGYKVETAQSGVAALEMAGQRHFDVVVLDYRMPEMTGLELARMLRQRFPSLPLVVLSGYTSDIPAELKGLISGFVTKGSHPEVLLEVLAGVLGASPRNHPKRGEKTTAELLARAVEHVAESKRQIQRAHDMAERGRRKRR
jgi:two-component system response regulator GlrR